MPIIYKWVRVSQVAISLRFGSFTRSLVERPNDGDSSSRESVIRTHKALFHPFYCGSLPSVEHRVRYRVVRKDHDVNIAYVRVAMLISINYRNDVRPHRRSAVWYDILRQISHSLFEDHSTKGPTFILLSFTIITSLPQKGRRVTVLLSSL